MNTKLVTILCSLLMLAPHTAQAASRSSSDAATIVITLEDVNGYNLNIETIVPTTVGRLKEQIASHKFGLTTQGSDLIITSGKDGSPLADEYAITDFHDKKLLHVHSSDPNYEIVFEHGAGKSTPFAVSLNGLLIGSDDVRPHLPEAPGMVQEKLKKYVQEHVHINPALDLKALDMKTELRTRYKHADAAPYSLTVNGTPLELKHEGVDVEAAQKQFVQGIEKIIGRADDQRGIVVIALTTQPKPLIQQLCIVTVDGACTKINDARQKELVEEVRAFIPMPETRRIESIVVTTGPKSILQKMVIKFDGRKIKLAGKIETTDGKQLVPAAELEKTLKRALGIHPEKAITKVALVTGENS